MLAVTMCHGNCAACKVKRTVSVNKTVQQVVELRRTPSVPTEPAPIQEEPVKTEELSIAENLAVEEASDEKEGSVEGMGLALYEPSGQVETYKIAKTRKGFLGKLVGGIA